MPLNEEHCKPATKSEALSVTAAAALLKELKQWQITEDGEWLEKHFKLTDFTEALALASRIGEIANRENHHPDLELGYGYLKCWLQTHDVGGLHRNDFILAAKIDGIA